MALRFKRHNSLRLFLEIAHHPSLSAAAETLNMTKGAISYQIKVLEDELQTQLIHRKPRGFVLTHQGDALVKACQPQFTGLEDRLQDFVQSRDQVLTVGLSSYFAARWLSPRLMNFMAQYPEIRLRLQPMTRLFDLEHQGVDIAIRWGNGKWDDAKVEPFLKMPAWPVGNHTARNLVESKGMEKATRELTLLRDHDDSDAWTDWAETSGLQINQRNDALIVPDPNVRVQAVIDGQGVALMDELVAPEMRDGRLLRLSEFELSKYGYFLVVPLGGQQNKAASRFRDWLQISAVHQEI